MLPSERDPVDIAVSRFSVNSNLMNYSIPRQQEAFDEAITLTPNPLRASSFYKGAIITDDGSTKREIQSGDVDTRTRQLEAQIEHLTLQNVKLQRTNRLLKVDTDNLIKQKTEPLEKTIQELTVANVKLQRTARLLQQELEEKAKELNTMKQDQILKMKSVGPEYEFLVQNINLLQRQIAGQPICEDTCCFTMQPIDQSTMVMTLPSTYSSSSSSLCSSSSEGDGADRDDDELPQTDGVEAQHICRPVIHSTVSQGSYATELEKKIMGLEQFIEELDMEKEQILKQQSYKDSDIETLKRELRIKDEIVSQLEQDFMGLEDQLEQLQKELQDQSIFPPQSPSIHRPNSDASTVSTAPTMIAIDDSRHLQPPTGYAYPFQSDPRRQSQLLMESKRKSLAIKDVDLLEEMLKDDLEKFNGRPSSFDSEYQRSSFISAADSFSDQKEITVESTQTQQRQQGFNESTVRSSSPQSTVIDDEDEASLGHAMSNSSNSSSQSDSLNRKGSIIFKENTTASSSISIPADLLCLSCVGFPCAYLCHCSFSSTSFSSCSTTVHKKPSYHLQQQLINSKRHTDAFTQFAYMAVIMGIVSALGITDDWTVPFALAIMVSASLFQSADISHGEQSGSSVTDRTTEDN